MSRKFFCTAAQRISMRGNELASVGMVANLRDGTLDKELPLPIDEKFVAGMMPK